MAQSTDGAVESGSDGSGGLVDRDSSSGIGVVELSSLAMAVAVDWSTEMVAVVSMQWSGVESGGGSASTSVDRDGGSGVDAVELTSLAASAAVDRWTETGAVASMQWSCRVWRWQRLWIGR